MALNRCWIFCMIWLPLQAMRCQRLGGRSRSRFCASDIHLELRCAPSVHRLAFVHRVWAKILGDRISLAPGNRAESRAGIDCRGKRRLLARSLRCTQPGQCRQIAGLEIFLGEM